MPSPEQERPEPRPLPPSLPSPPPQPHVAPPAPPEPVSPPRPTKPETPAFTPELLASVNNWQAVSSVYFPLHGVSLQKSFPIPVRAPDGQVVGNMVLDAGTEVVALALQGGVLRLLPSATANAHQAFAVRVDDTDFKQCVAYKYEMRKKREADLRAWRTQTETLPSALPPHSSATLANKPGGALRLPAGAAEAPPRGSLFEDIPPPMDFGHGKFCVCGDCREKRAQAAKGRK